MAESYEQIKDRMLRNASRMWGVTTREDEAAFDPLVGLLIEACASEMEGLSREISSSHLRLTQKLIELMNPGVDSGVKPAHSIAKAEPAEARLTITPDTQFNCKSILTNHFKSGQQETLFVPAGIFELFDANIEMVVHQQRVFQYGKDAFGSKTMYYEDSTLSSNPQQLWIGLSVNKKVKSFKGMNVYFNIPGSVERRNFFSLLDQAEWSVNNTPVKVHNGLYSTRNDHGIIEKKIKGETTKLEEALSEVNDFHNEYFRSIVAGNDLSGHTYMPGPGIKKEQIVTLGYNPEDIHWICIDFPRSLKPQMVESLTCHINTFPVVNLIQRNVQVKSREHLNLVPLNTENDYFFDIMKIEDSSGDTYKENVSFVKSHKIQKNYVLRSEGIQSFDSRSARELLITVIEKLKNENAAFRFLDLPSVTEDIRTLHQLVSRLESQLMKSPELKRPVFLYLEGSSINDHLFVDFWTTPGAAGNAITTESKLDLLEGAEIKSGSCKLLINCRGGADNPNLDEKLNVYRKTFLTRNRVVTSEDLKAFCYTWFGEVLTSVEIKKGVISGNNSNGGLLRCIEIHLQATSAFKLTDENLLWCKDFLIHLKKRSNNTFPYKIVINNKTLEL